MGKNGHHIILILVLFATGLSHSQEYLGEGLFFSSHEAVQEKRTSLNLTPDKSIQFEESFSLEFKAKFRDKDGYFGNIVRLIGNDRTDIGLVANINEKLRADQANFWLTVNDSILMSFGWKDIPNGGMDKWIDFGMHFDLSNSSITFSINGVKTTKSAENLDSLSDFRIIFGKSSFSNAFINDVCPMSVKHIEIRDHQKNLFRNWVLGKHTNDNIVYDEVAGAIAEVEHPIWLLDQHLFWEKDREFNFDNLIGTAKDESKKRIFFVDDKAVMTYWQETHKVDTLVYSGSPYPCMENTLMYNAYTNELLSYSFDESSISKFDFSNASWSLENPECKEPAYWHHNTIVSPKDSSLVTFGGYGFYSYKSHVKNLKDDIWSTVDRRNDIDPRYLSASGILNDDLFLIYGGHGTKTGNQVTKINHYYDLYAISFDDFTVKQIWESKDLFPEPMVPVESMVINSSLNHFYTLVFSNANNNSYLKLAKFGIDKPEMTLYPDSIPYTFKNSTSKADFFLDEDKSKLSALLIDGNKASLYTLSYPPLLPEEVIQEEVESSNALKLLGIFGIALIAGLGFFIVRKFLGGKKKTYPIEIEQEEKRSFGERFKFEHIKKSAIYIFGGFQVFDRNGNDITALFTPTLKQLFILILMYQSKNEKGISSNKLAELLWYDKIGNSANNNRNVNVSKLRILLEKIGDIQLTNENTYWTVSMGEGVFCDYIYAKDQLPLLVEDSSQEQVYRFIKTISAGEICPDIQTEWIDFFKDNIENLLIDGLEHLSKVQQDPELLVLIADTILKYAPLNENAITLKCRSLFAMGKKGLAKKSYDAFSQEYQTLLETNFEIPFGEIVD